MGKAKNAHAQQINAECSFQINTKYISVSFLHISPHKQMLMQISNREDSNHIIPAITLIASQNFGVNLSFS